MISNRFLFIFLILFCVSIFTELTSQESDYYYLREKLDSLQAVKYNKLNIVEEKLNSLLTNSFSKEDERLTLSKRELLSGVFYKLAFLYHEFEEYKELKDYEEIDFLRRQFVSNEIDSEEYLFKIGNILNNKHITIEDDPLELYTPSYGKSISLYNKIIDEYNGSDYFEDAIFNKGFILYENLKQKESSLEFFDKIITNYKKSKYYSVSNFIIGEYYFDPERNPDNNVVQDSILVNKSLKYYRAVIECADIDYDYYFKALYRVGFAYYRLYDYEKSAFYMTKTIEEINLKFGEVSDVEKRAMVNLCLDYLAFSYRDRPWQNEYDAVTALKNHILDRKNSGNSTLYTYGNKLLERLGYIYNQGDDYDLAITALDTLLSMYPTDYNAPETQQKIIEISEIKTYKNDEDRFNSLALEREQLFFKYNSSSSWRNSVQDKSDNVDSLISENMLININEYQVKAQNTGDKNLYEKTVELIDHYLSSLPEDDDFYRLKWYKASILGNQLNDYKSAFDIFINLSNDSKTSNYEDSLSGSQFDSKKAALSAIIMAQKIKETEK